MGEVKTFESQAMFLKTGLRLPVSVDVVSLNLTSRYESLISLYYYTISLDWERIQPGGKNKFSFVRFEAILLCNFACTVL